jgi:hypothetical protein
MITGGLDNLCLLCGGDKIAVIGYAATAAAPNSRFSPWGEVPSACEAMRGSHWRIRRSWEPLIRPFGPPSPQGEKREADL